MRKLYKVGVALAHSWSKTTMRQQFRVLFATILTSQKGICFCINMWQWMKHGSTTSLWSQINSQLGGQLQVKAVQSDQRHKHQQERFWLLYFRLHKVFCSSITLRNEEPSRANITEHYWCVLKEEIIKKGTQMKKEKSTLSLKQCPVSLWIDSAPALFSKSGSQQLLAVWRPQKNALGKEFWLQWRSDIRHWGVFWGQRQIILQKRHRIVREMLESVYHPRRRLCW